MTKWALIATTVFVGRRLGRVARTVGAAPSTLKLIVPEAYLGEVDTAESAAEIAGNMREYLRSGLMKPYDNSLIYAERTISDGRPPGTRQAVSTLSFTTIRPALKCRCAPARRRSSPGCPRVDIRRLAPLELPHIMALIDDSECRVIEPLGKNKYSGEGLRFYADGGLRFDQGLARDRRRHRGNLRRTPLPGRQKRRTDRHRRREPLSCRREGILGRDQGRFWRRRAPDASGAVRPCGTQ